MKLTAHFNLSEFTRSETASERHIDNTPTASAVTNLKHLCEQVLEPLRCWYGKPITIGSGYRCPKLNAAVGGVKNSQHMTGEAADLQVVLNVSKSNPEAYNAELRRLFDFIKSNLPYDQLILERNKPTSKTYWIHVSCKKDITRNRKQVIVGLVKNK